MKNHRYRQWHGGKIDDPPAPEPPKTITINDQPKCPPLPVVRADYCPGCGVPGGRQCRIVRSSCGY